MKEAKTVVYGLFCECPGCVENSKGEIRYVGITVEGLDFRLGRHLVESRTNSQKAKDRWIRKHGEENIRGRVLEVVTTGIEDLRIAEIGWISKLGTFESPRGLNMTRGGEGVWGYKFSEEVKERFRERTARQFAVKHPQAKMTEDQVKEVIRRLWTGESCPSIAKDFGVKPATIQKIRSGDNWPQIDRPSTPVPKNTLNHGKRKVLDSQAQKIKDEYTGTYGDYAALGRKYGLSAVTVSDIINGKNRYKVVE